MNAEGKAALPPSPCRLAPSGRTPPNTGTSDGPIRDRETGSTWSITGTAVDGELTGSQLEPVVHGDHFSFAWAAFAPDTTIWPGE